MPQQTTAIDLIYQPVREQLVQVEKKLRDLASQGHPSISSLLGQVAGSPGKRLRPAVTLLASGFHDEGGDLPITMAAAVELLHVASLVHDDTVDNAAVRRGAATVSSMWGDNVAVLLGDYVFASSAVLVCDTNNVHVIRRFAETIKELSTGELMEQFGAYKWGLSMEEYKERIYNKTASLFRTAAESGAILSGAPDETVRALDSYGYNIGMAFQIVDDILDFEGTEEEFGKPVGNDLLQGTLTLPTILLMERYPDDNPVKRLFQNVEPDGNLKRAVEMIQSLDIIPQVYSIAAELHQKAVQALEPLPDSIYKRSLVDLAAYAMERRR
jgi:heptaprenyl diphosphate synthase/octaprenyl-diphosphate synthase